jgi:hypothetical protein
MKSRLMMLIEVTSVTNFGRKDKLRWNGCSGHVEKLGYKFDFGNKNPF